MVNGNSVARILKEMGYSLQANRKKIALSGNGSQQERHQRDQQFRHICRMREIFTRRKEPTISVDTKKHGCHQYPHAKRILILADNGGSNNPSFIAWKYHLWNILCQKHGLTVIVCHYPTGASKWNPIEHRLFSEISKNWAGIPLETLQTVLNYIRKTKTDSGLSVEAILNRKHYALKETIPHDKIDRIVIKTNFLFPKLNYILLPAK